MELLRIDHMILKQYGRMEKNSKIMDEQKENNIL